MNFLEQHALTSDNEFRDRVEMALFSECLRIVMRRPADGANEAALAAHGHEVTYARSVLDSLAMRPGQELRSWYALVAVDVDVEDDGETILDAEITKSIRKVIRGRTRNLFS